MFKAELNENGYWIKGVFQAANDVVDQIIVQVTDEGLRFVALDPAHIQFVDVKLPATFFDEYSHTEDMEFAIDLDELTTAIKRYKKGDLIGFEDYGQNRILLKLTGKAEKNFLINKVDGYEPGYAPVPPELDFPANVQIDVIALKEMLYDMSLVSKDNVLIGVEGDTLSVSNENTKMKLKGRITYDGENGMCSAYSLSKVRNSLRNLLDVNNATIRIGKDTPLEFMVERNTAVFSTLTAPKIDPDGEPYISFEELVPYEADEDVGVEMTDADDSEKSYRTADMVNGD